jgi:drug/metabolite transporter (DMT)-like permease
MALGQIAQKVATRDLGTDTLKLQSLLGLLRSVWFWSACVLLACALVFWLIVLSTMELHTAYPALSFSFVLTALLSTVLLGERLRLAGWIGIAIISVGVYLLLGSQGA